MFKFLKEKLSNLIKGSKETEEPVEKKAKAPVKDVKENTGEKIKKLGKKQEIHKKQKEKNEEEVVYSAEKIEGKPEINELEEKIIEEANEIVNPEIEEKTSFFSKFKKKFTSKLDQGTFNNFFEKLEQILLENNVALGVVDKIREDMEKDLVNIEIKKENIEDEVKKSLKNSIERILVDPFDIMEKIKLKKEGPFIILFFGINGSGKTTSIAKLTHKLQKNNIPCVLAAGDTFRAASIEQLNKHGEKLGVKVISQDYGADPAAVAFDAIKYATSHGLKVVLIDTAGRMHTKDNLIKEMEKIIRVTKPDMKIFVAESITGNDATEQAKIFNESFGIDGTILTKADVDEKGGTAISVGFITGKPILMLGTGQNYDDLEVFSKEEIISNLGLD
ncbi:signal recognition particle-docking protein FtsY [Candidatus Pacearchaeota archaeon]|nr:signal recognition particle-docking protein FtsY [Candidatus Pacearchaeota archaeon]